MSENHSQVTIEFELPVGFTDPDDGRVHKTVVMRRITAADMISISKDIDLKALAKVQVEANSANPVQVMFAVAANLELDIFLFARTIIHIGTLPTPHINRANLAKLDMKDIAMFREQYTILNDMTVAQDGGGSGPLAASRPS